MWAVWVTSLTWLTRFLPKECLVIGVAFPVGIILLLPIFYRKVLTQAKRTVWLHSRWMVLLGTKI